MCAVTKRMANHGSIDSSNSRRNKRELRHVSCEHFDLPFVVNWTKWLRPIASADEKVDNPISPC